MGEVYGSKYREKVPEAAASHAELGKIFQAKTKRTAHQRYEEVLALRKDYVTHVASLPVNQTANQS